MAKSIPIQQVNNGRAAVIVLNTCWHTTVAKERWRLVGAVDCTPCISRVFPEIAGYRDREPVTFCRVASLFFLGSFDHVRVAWCAVGHRGPNHALQLTVGQRWCVAVIPESHQIQNLRVVQPYASVRLECCHVTGEAVRCLVPRSFWGRRRFQRVSCCTLKHQRQIIRRWWWRAVVAVPVVGRLIDQLQQPLWRIGNFEFHPVLGTRPSDMYYR